MNTSLKILAVAGVALSLAACSTESVYDNDTFATPYTLERTAVAEQHTTMAAPQPAPVLQCPACPTAQCDYSAWESRVAALEAELNSCKESSSRVRDAYREELTK
ncbi:MAG: hypothetical protein KDJ35_09280 [Alphaproteobacteria bacterium]|nr:hypothetical protein [Alphaproteobacteria bacterium]